MADLALKKAPAYDPIGAMGGLFAPAYLFGNPESEAAVAAWNAKNRKKRPTGDYAPPAPAAADPRDAVTAALLGIGVPGPIRPPGSVPPPSGGSDDANPDAPYSDPYGTPDFGGVPVGGPSPTLISNPPNDIPPAAPPVGYTNPAAPQTPTTTTTTPTTTTPTAPAQAPASTAPAGQPAQGKEGSLYGADLPAGTPGVLGQTPSSRGGFDPGTFEAANAANAKGAQDYAAGLPQAPPAPPQGIMGQDRDQMPGIWGTMPQQNIQDIPQARDVHDPNWGINPTAIQGTNLPSIPGNKGQIGPVNMDIPFSQPFSMPEDLNFAAPTPVAAPEPFDAPHANIGPQDPSYDPDITGLYGNAYGNPDPGLTGTATIGPAQGGFSTYGQPGVNDQTGTFGDNTYGGGLDAPTGPDALGSAFGDLSNAYGGNDNTGAPAGGGGTYGGDPSEGTYGGDPGVASGYGSENTGLGGDAYGSADPSSTGTGTVGDPGAGFSDGYGAGATSYGDSYGSYGEGYGGYGGGGGGGNDNSGGPGDGGTVGGGGGEGDSTSDGGGGW